MHTGMHNQVHLLISILRLTNRTFGAKKSNACGCHFLLLPLPLYLLLLALYLPLPDNETTLSNITRTLIIGDSYVQLMWHNN